MKLIEIDEEYVSSAIADVKKKLPAVKQAVIYSRHALAEDFEEVYIDASTALRQIEDKLRELTRYLEEQLD